MFFNGERTVLMEDVTLSLPRECGDEHMRLADLDVLGSAYSMYYKQRRLLACPLHQPLWLWRTLISSRDAASIIPSTLLHALTMTLYAKPASETPLSKLPPELASVIFDLVSVNCRPNAANCRLVCQDFHTLCSPFLIRTIVIAERYEALLKARELLLHPFFGKHITHLLWDASYYDQTYASDYPEYEAAFYASKYLQGSYSSAYSLQRRADAIMQRQLRRNGPSAPSVPAALRRGMGRLLDYDVEARSEEDGHGRPIQHELRAIGIEYDKPHPPSVPQSRPFVPSDIQEYGYLRGCHLGHADYFRRWVNQESMRGRDTDEGSDDELNNAHGMSIEAENIATKEWDIDGNLARFYFRRAIKELPNLQHIMYGDYRTLAFDGETYANLCRRLFDRTVCPSVGFPSVDAGTGFLDFWNDLVACHRTWTSLSVGRHPFETSYADQGTAQSGEYTGPSTQSDVTMDYTMLLTEDHDFQLPKLQVRSLKLPTLNIDVEDIYKLGRLSKKFGQGLLELDLGTTSFSTYAKPSAEPVNSYDIFRPLLVPSQPDFTNLRSVTLRGFVFDVAMMQDFLLGLAPTLRTLRLIDCFCRDSHDVFQSFAKDTITPALALTGVELYGLRFGDGAPKAEDQWIRFTNEQFNIMRRDDRILDEEFPVTRPNNRVWDTEALRKRGKAINMDMVSDWPYERFELEATMLGGRANKVARHVRTPPALSARSYWYDVQTFYA